MDATEGNGREREGRDGARLDLDPDSRSSLEFDAVLDLVAGHAATRIGAERIRAIEPISDEDALYAEHATVEEAAAHLSRFGRFVPGALPDPAPALSALPVEGLSIEAAALRDLATVLDAGVELRSSLLRLPAAEFPRLRNLAAAIPDLRAETLSILRGVGPDGRLSDDASPELRRIRTALARVGERLRRMLESYLHEPGADTVIRDEFVTQRNGRYVIPVRTDAPRPIKGIVHAASSSGATLFVEPMDSVELNNDLVRLTEEEIVEHERVVRGWAQRLRDRLGEVTEAVGRLAAADTFQARALFAASAGGVRPAVRRGAPLRLRDVRHPLLDRRLRETGQRCVPVSVELDPADRVLMLSGPNAGGKTVALKTLGLAALMAHSGLPVVAAEASLPVLHQVRADIGDHQSIEADLSTFSAHVRAVGRFLDEVRAPVLLLFDEIGTGTEPTEGAALAQAVLERLGAPGVSVVATTHLAALKAWAFTAPGAVSAAMEFDTETMRPTFRVLMGAAGISAGIEIASRLGLPESLVARARSLLGEGGRQTEAYLSRIRDLTADLEARQAGLVAAGEGLAEERRRLEARAAEEAEKRRNEASRALEEALGEFREQGRREILAIRDKRERARIEKDQVRSEMRLRSEMARRTARMAQRPAAAEPEADTPFEPRPGVRVLVRSLDREGEIAAVRGDKLEVALGAVSITVRRSDVAPASKAFPVASPKDARPAPAGPGPGLEDEAPREIVLIGMTIDEALPELDRFLDRAALSGLHEVRVVHGHGTGRLRAAVRRFVSGHPHVEAHRSGAPREGGDGATVLTLR